MGFYINPEEGTKEEFLEKNGAFFFIVRNGFQNRPEGKLPVILIMNPTFSAAAVAFSEEEYQHLVLPEGRTKVGFYVPIEKLIPVTQPNLKTVLKEK